MNARVNSRGGLRSAEVGQNEEGGTCDISGEEAWRAPASGLNAQRTFPKGVWVEY